MANDPRSRDTALALGAPLFAAALLSVAYEIGARQTDAYLGPGLATARGVAVGLSALGLVTGYVGGVRWLRRVTHRGQLFLHLVMALCLLCSASAPLWFWAFGTPKAMPFVACCVPGAAGLLAGTALGALVQASALPYRELQSVRLLLAPAPLVGALLLALLVSTALSYLGVWRAAAALAGALAVLCSLIPRWGEYWGDRSVPARWPSVVALASAAFSFAAAQAFVPAALLARYPAELIWADAEADTVVISAQNTFELFEAQQLRTSSADDYRLAELAVHPALSGLPVRRRVLVLGPAGGFLEREVLRYPDVTEVVSLSELDRATFLRSLWPQLTFREVSGDARLRFVSAEPMPWLEQHASSFDLILVCLPGPASAAEGKYYTRYFYELLVRRLTSRGVLVVQATSRETLPDTFATLRASLSSAGLTVSSYEAPIPLLGSTSFLVGSRAVLPEPVARTLPNGLRFLDLPALHRSFATLATAPVPAEVSTLAHQHAVVTWHVEQAKLGN